MAEAKELGPEVMPRKGIGERAAIWATETLAPSQRGK